MIASTTSKKLLTALSSVGGIIKPTTVPILENLLVEISENVMTITADNLEARSIVSIPVTSESSIKTCIPHDIFSKVIKGLPDTPIDLDFGDACVTIDYGSGSAKIPLIPAEEFPLPQIIDTENLIELNSFEFANAIKKATTFIDESRLDAVCNLLIKVSEDKIQFVGLSGHAGIETTINIGGTEAQILLLKSSANYLQSAIKSDETIKVSWSDRSIRVIGEDTNVTVVLSEGKYPDYERLFPKKGDNVYYIEPEAILPSLKRIANMADKDHTRIDLNFTENNLVLSHENNDFGHSSQESVSVNYSGEPILIGFNGNYFRNAITNFGEGSKMYLIAPDKPCVIEGEDIRGLLSPMWIK